MNSEITANIFRFMGLAITQVLVFQQIFIWPGEVNYAQVILYPLFVLLLPIRTPTPLVLLLGFLIGITVDIFYDSLGIHASATVFMAFARRGVLALLAPRGGYNVNYTPGKYRMGINWFLQYSSILFFLHLLFYFSVEAFTFVYIVDILLKTFFSFIISMVFVLVYIFIFDPKE